MNISKEQPTFLGLCKTCNAELYQLPDGSIRAGSFKECYPGEVHKVRFISRIQDVMNSLTDKDYPEFEGTREAALIAAQKLADNIDAEILQSYIQETSKNEPSEKRGE